MTWENQKTVVSAQHWAYPPEIENAITVILEQTTQEMFMVMKKYATQCNNMTLLCVFNSFRQQSFIAQWNKLCYNTDDTC